MQELICLIYFYITTSSLLYSLRLQGGGYSPHSPPKSAIGLWVNGSNACAVVEFALFKAFQLFEGENWPCDTFLYSLLLKINTDCYLKF